MIFPNLPAINLSHIDNDFESWTLVALPKCEAQNINVINIKMPQILPSSSAIVKIQLLLMISLT